MFSRSPSALPAHAPRAHGASRATDLCVSLAIDSASNFVGAAGCAEAGHVEACATVLQTRAEALWVIAAAPHVRCLQQSGDVATAYRLPPTLHNRHAVE